MTRFGYIICFFIASTSLGSTAMAYIGGFEPVNQMPGVVRLGAGDFFFQKCTGTMVTSQYLFTAAHCLSKDPSVLLNVSFSYPPPFKELIEVRAKDGSLIKEQVIVEEISVFASSVFGYDEKNVPGSADEKFGHLVERGDFAIIKLREPVKNLKSFPKIAFLDSGPSTEIWVGGFGKQLIIPEDFFKSRYLGTPARFGKLRNAFYRDGLSGFERESLVSIELLNVRNEITYLGRGDSGGGVFSIAGGEVRLMGVNHAGSLIDPTDLKLETLTNRVLERSTEFGGDVIGFAHVFNRADLQLEKWLAQKLPSDAF